MPPPPQGPQLLKKLVGWQEMATWWVNIVTIFQTSGHWVTWSLGNLVIWSFSHIYPHNIWSLSRQKTTCDHGDRPGPGIDHLRRWLHDSGMFGVCGCHYIIYLVYVYILRVSVGIFKKRDQDRDQGRVWRHIQNIVENIHPYHMFINFGSGPQRKKKNKVTAWKTWIDFVWTYFAKLGPGQWINIKFE